MTWSSPLRERWGKSGLFPTMQDTLGMLSRTSSCGHTWIQRSFSRFSPSIGCRVLKWFSTSSNTTHGSTVPLINLSVLRQLPLPVPPLAEQRAIARILGSLDDKIELNRRMNRTLEELAAAIFKAWFVDFDPVVARAGGPTAVRHRGDRGAVPGRVRGVGDGGGAGRVAGRDGWRSLLCAVRLYGRHETRGTGGHLARLLRATSTSVRSAMD